MKGQRNVATPKEYLLALREPRRSEVAELDALIRKTAPKLEPFILGGMLAYGRTRCTYANGKEQDWFKIGVASNASYISLYVRGTAEDGSISEQHRKALPKANIGKGCVRFKRMSDLDTAVLKRVIREGAKARVQ
jgi:hypothetical protein